MNDKKQKRSAIKVLSFLTIAALIIPLTFSQTILHVSAAPAATPNKTLSEYIENEWDIDKPLGITYKKKKMVVGQKFTLKLNGIDGKKRWVSSNSSVASVSSKGVVTALKKGYATITGMANNKKYTCKITVSKRLLFSDTTDLTLDVGEEQDITITLKSPIADEIYIDSEDVLMIDYDFGEWDGDEIPITITALYPGETVVTVSNRNTSEKVKINVIVNEDPDDYDYEDDYYDDEDYDDDYYEDDYDEDDYDYEDVDLDGIH